MSAVTRDKWEQTVEKSGGCDDLTRDRAIRLFIFLRELAKLKTGVTRDLPEYEDVVWLS